MARFRRLRRRLRPYRPLVVLVAVAVLGTGLWIVVTGLLAVRDLRAMQRDLVAVQAAVSAEPTSSSGTHRLEALAESASEHGRAAGDRTDDVIWKVWSRAPLVGSSVQAVGGISDAARSLGSGGLVPLADAARSLSLVRTGSGRFDLEPLAAQLRALQRSAAATAKATLIAERLRPCGIGAIDSRLREVRKALDEVAARSAALRTMARIGPELVGQLGPRRYLLAVQNNAEARASGGIVGAYGVLGFDSGRATIEFIKSDASLLPQARNAVDLGPEWRRRYDRLGQARDWREVTATPDFPTAAVQMLGLWGNAHSGEKLAGVISVDPVALADILMATGPVHDKHGRELQASTFVRYALSDAYRLFPDKQARTDALADAAHAVFDALIAGRGSNDVLAERLGHAVLNRHLAVFSSTAPVQTELTSTRLAQALPSEAAPLLGVITQDALGSKLSYYLRRRISYATQPVTTALDVGDGKGPQPVQRAVLTITLTNTAPASGLPEYVAPATEFESTTRVVPGTARVAVSTYLARSGLLESADLDGRHISVVSETEQGLSVLSTTLVLPPGGSTTLVMHVLQPAPRGRVVTVLEQPLAFPDLLTVT